jgi:hypothetical protein
LPTLSFVINSFALEVEDGTALTGRLVWGNESKISIFEAMRRGAGPSHPMRSPKLRNG